MYATSHILVGMICCKNYHLFNFVFVFHQYGSFMLAVYCGNDLIKLLFICVWRWGWSHHLVNPSSENQPEIKICHHNVIQKK